jgi:hypothetical protein
MKQKWEKSKDILYTSKMILELKVTLPKHFKSLQMKHNEIELTKI